MDEFEAPLVRDEDVDCVSELELAPVPRPAPRDDTDALVGLRARPGAAFLSELVGDEIEVVEASEARAGCFVCDFFDFVEREGVGRAIVDSGPGGVDH